MKYPIHINILTHKKTAKHKFEITCQNKKIVIHMNTLLAFELLNS